MNQPILPHKTIALLAKNSPAPIKSWARRQLKYRHEWWASQTLLDLLQFEYLKTQPGDPRHSEPDIIARTNQAVLGIEVTTIYYDQDQAKQTWDRIKGDIQPAPNQQPQRQTDHLFIYNLQQAINRKSEKRYQLDGPLWLCLVQLESFQSSYLPQELQKSIDTSQATSFQKIYFLYPSLPDQWQVVELKGG